MFTFWAKHSTSRLESLNLYAQYQFVETPILDHDHRLDSLFKCDAFLLQSLVHVNKFGGGASGAGDKQPLYLLHEKDKVFSRLVKQWGPGEQVLSNLTLIWMN